MWPQSCAVGSVQTPPPTMTLTFFALAMHEHLLARNTSLLSSHQSLEKTGADYFSKLYLSLSFSLPSVCRQELYLAREVNAKQVFTRPFLQIIGLFVAIFLFSYLLEFLDFFLGKHASPQNLFKFQFNFLGLCCIFLNPF